MHFIVVGPMYHHYSESVVRTLNQLGHAAVFFPEMPFYENCSYLQRKLYKFGYRTLKMKWEKDWQKSAIRFGQEQIYRFSVPYRRDDYGWHHGCMGGVPYSSLHVGFHSAL